MPQAPEYTAAECLAARARPTQNLSGTRDRRWEKRLHDYRRSFARRMEPSGVPRSTAMKITGHRTEHVFRQHAVGEEEDVPKASATVLTTVASDKLGAES